MTLVVNKRMWVMGFFSRWWNFNFISHSNRLSFFDDVFFSKNIFEGSANLREWMEFHAVQIWWCETTVNTFKWDINSWMKSSCHHHMRVVCTESNPLLLFLGCKPQMIFRNRCAHFNVLFCIFYFAFRICSSRNVGCWRSKHDYTHLFDLFTHTRASSHQNIRKITTWRRENSRRKSRSLYEYEIIIILSTLHNPSGFCCLHL